MMIYLVLLFIHLFILASPTYAVCPVCTIAIGAGVGLSRYLGIDDTISGVLIGALVLSSAFWLSNWAEKRRIKFLSSKILSAAIFYLLTIPHLYLTNIMGHPLNTIWGIDRLLLGIITGSTLFILSARIDKFLRSKNNGKVYMPYQKVIIPVTLLICVSILFYFLTK